MSWNTVNVAGCGSHQLQNSPKGRATSDEPPSAYASKFRVNILHAAAQLTICDPGRKRRASKAATGGPTSKKSKKIFSNRKETGMVQTVNNSIGESPTSSKRRSARLQTPNPDNPPEPAMHTNAAECETLDILRQATYIDNPANLISVEKALQIKFPAGERVLDSSKVQCSTFEVDASSADYTRTETLADVLSNDASTDFGDFDDSIFNEPLQAGLAVDSLQQTSSPSATPVYGVISASRELDIKTPESSSTAEIIVNYPNGAPFAPFMHPCLLDYLEAGALAFNRKDVSIPSIRHTCFRTAELLRLSKSFKSERIAPDQYLVTDLFTTVKEVKFANSRGQGQGLVLADAFFPDKPPYITASSRIPYSAKDVIPRGQEKGGIRNLVKATIKISGPKTVFMSQETPLKLSQIKSSDIARQKSCSILSSPEFEVTDVQASS